MSSDSYSSDFVYKKYSLEQLDEWVHDAINCEDLTPQEIYDTIVNAVDENVEYHKKHLTRNIDLLSLLKGQRPVNLNESVSEATNKDWTDFWEEDYYPEESHHYTEEELDAMCDAAAEQEERDKCREYNMREAEYYNQRAKLDADYAKSKYYYDGGRNK